MKKILCIILIGICIFICGCGLKSNNQACASPPESNYKKSESMDFDIYLDGTTSMYGYVNYTGGTVYGNSVKEIERTISENWKKETTQFIKFGDDFTKLSRDEFLQMDQPTFYNQKDTSLQKVIDQADSKKVNIIVTDLFQTNQDIDSLLLSLKNKCIVNGQAIAIIGIKSQFNGKIFDVGKNLSTFDYASSDDPKSFRPFYLLVFGNENDTREFVKSYKKHIPESTQIQVAFISHNIGIDNSLETDKISKNEKKEKGVATLAEISTILPDSNIKQYRLKTSEKLSKADMRFFSKNVIGKCADTYSIKMEKLEKLTNSTDTKSNKTGILNRIFGEKSNKGQSSFEEMKADDFFTGTVTDTGIKNGNFNCALTFKVSSPSIHKQVGKYRLCFSLIPDREQYLTSNNIFDKWNFNDGQIEENPEILKQLGSKTLNISKFVSQLSNLNYELNAPGFHDIYIYFDAI